MLDVGRRLQHVELAPADVQVVSRRLSHETRRISIDDPPRTTVMPPLDVFWDHWKTKFPAVPAVVGGPRTAVRGSPMLPPPGEGIVWATEVAAGRSWVES